MAERWSEQVTVDGMSLREFLALNGESLEDIEDDEQFIFERTQQISLPALQRTSLRGGFLYDFNNRAYLKEDKAAAGEFFEQGFHICYSKHLSH